MDGAAIQNLAEKVLGDNRNITSYITSNEECFKLQELVFSGEKAIKNIGIAMASSSMVLLSIAVITSSLTVTSTLATAAACLLIAGLVFSLIAPCMELDNSKFISYSNILPGHWKNYTNNKIASIKEENVEPSELCGI